MAEPSLVDPDVEDNTREQRYEIRSDGRLVGFADYERSDGRIWLTHTEIDSTFERQGYASRLIKVALDEARRQHLTVRPLCSFVSAYIRRHREYADLVEPVE